MTFYRFGAVLAAAALASGAALAQDRTGWPDPVSIGTAAEGGSYFAYGTGMAELLGGELDLGATPEPTGGPVQNVALVQTGDLDFGMVTMGPAFEAWNGQSPLAPGLRHEKLRAIFPMYQTPFEVITLASSGISSVEGLADKTVGVGPAGGTADMYFPRFLETLGIPIQTRNGGVTDLASQLQDGLIDAFAYSGTLPIPAFAQLQGQTEVNIFAFTPAQVDTLIAEYPYVTRYTVAAGTYTDQAEPRDTVAMWSFAVARSDLPDDLVYEVVRTVMENHDRLVEAEPAAAETLPENVARDDFLPFHPGAVRWYQENGVDIPDELEGQ